MFSIIRKTVLGDRFYFGEDDSIEFVSRLIMLIFLIEFDSANFL